MHKGYGITGNHGSEAVLSLTVNKLTFCTFSFSTLYTYPPLDKACLSLIIFLRPVLVMYDGVTNYSKTQWLQTTVFYIIFWCGGWGTGVGCGWEFVLPSFVTTGVRKRYHDGRCANQMSWTVKKRSGLTWDYWPHMFFLAGESWMSHMAADFPQG